MTRTAVVTNLAANPGERMDAEMILVRRIALVAVVLGALATVFALVTAGGIPGLSVALGTAVGMANLWALAELLGRIFKPGSDTSKARASALLVAKMVLLYAVVGVILTRPWVSAGWFMVGITACVIAIVAAGLWPSPPSGPNDPDKGNPVDA